MGYDHVQRLLFEDGADPDLVVKQLNDADLEEHLQDLWDARVSVDAVVESMPPKLIAIHLAELIRHGVKHKKLMARAGCQIIERIERIGCAKMGIGPADLWKLGLPDMAVANLTTTNQRQRIREVDSLSRLMDDEEFVKYANQLIDCGVRLEVRQLKLLTDDQLDIYIQARHNRQPYQLIGEPGNWTLDLKLRGLDRLRQYYARVSVLTIVLYLDVNLLLKYLSSLKKWGSSDDMRVLYRRCNEAQQRYMDEMM